MEDIPKIKVLTKFIIIAAYMASKSWIPASGLNNSCRKCGQSHEAEDFLSSLLDIASAEFLESKEYMEFLSENGFTEDVFLEEE